MDTKPEARNASGAGHRISAPSTWASEPGTSRTVGVPWLTVSIGVVYKGFSDVYNERHDMSWHFRLLGLQWFRFPDEALLEGSGKFIFN